MIKFILFLLFIVLFAGCQRNITAEFIEEISSYSDFSTVDWSELSDKYYHSNVADWDSVTNKHIINGFPKEIAAELWHLLQNARADFHQKSLPLRAVASENVINAINRTETMFDIVFVRCVSLEYYMRLFPEIYNETMNPAIDELVCELANNLKTEAPDKISLNAIGLFGEDLYVTGIDLDKKYDCYGFNVAEFCNDDNIHILRLCLTDYEPA